MAVPKDIGRPPEIDDGGSLYRMPENFRAYCEGAAAAGLAHSPEAFWYYEQRGKPPNLAFMRSLLGSIIRAVPADKSESRNEVQRLDDAMKAVFGRTAAWGSNEKDDAATLAVMAWRALEIDGGDEALRRIARELLSGRNLGATTLESAVRRLVRKFKADRAGAEAIARGEDTTTEILEYMALREIASLLHSVGVPTDYEMMSM